MPNPIRATGLAVLAAVLMSAALHVSAAVAQNAPDTYNRGHEHGLTTLRFHKGQLHFALVLDAVPRENAPRQIVTADGRTVKLHWSGRSLWIDEAKYELPFGAVFLLSTRDSLRVKQLEFNAMRGRLLLDQAMRTPEASAWLAEHGDADGEVRRGEVQASTYPRHTLETTAWSYRGARAFTCVVSGSPLFVLFADGPIAAGSSTQTFFGNLEFADALVGEGDARRTFRASPTQATFIGQTFDLAKGRVFLISKGNTQVAQVNASLDAGFAQAAALADEIERMPAVRAHLGLGDQP